MDKIGSKIDYRDGCHIWKGTMVKKKFPYYNSKNVRKFIWDKNENEISQQEIIRMTCKNENERCVNIEHMYLHSTEKTWDERQNELLSKTSLGGPDGECNVWNGFKNEDGYGVSKYKEQSITTHRLSYILKTKNDIIPSKIGNDNSCVMHLCGFRSCINPEHLQLGTDKENASHRDGHGTLLTGESHPRSTINKETAEKILLSKRKTDDSDYETRKEIAKRFKTSVSVVKGIYDGYTWKKQLSHIQRVLKPPRKLKNKSDLILGFQQGAHLWSCEIKNKRSIEEKEVTMHFCNNKACFNPDHLEFGTYKENSNYAIESGSKSCKLKKDDVIKIRNSILTQRELSIIYKVSEETVRRVKRKDTYKTIK